MTTTTTARAPSARIGAPAEAGRLDTPVVLDAEQRRVVAHRGGPLLVLGAPGTGRTTALVAHVVARLRAGECAPDQVLVLSADRRAAAALRLRITRSIGGVFREPVARSLHSLAFGLLHLAAVRQGEPAPRLTSGPEQDAMVRELLEGAGRDAAPAGWPASLHAALRTAGFAAEVRELMLRAQERGLTPGELAALGRRHDRRLWVPAAAFMREYLQVQALRGGPRLVDAAGLVASAVAELEADDLLLTEQRRRYQLIAVDDAHELDPAQVRLVELLAGRRDGLLLTASPEQAVLTFRGSDPAAVATLGALRGSSSVEVLGEAATEVVLRHPHRWHSRGEPALQRVAAAVAARVSGSGDRRTVALAEAGRGDGPRQDDATAGAAVHLLPSAAQEAAHVADWCRQVALLDGIAWGRVAVLVRSTNELDRLRAALRSAGVPVDQYGETEALTSLPAAAALLALLRRCASDGPMDAGWVAEQLASPLVGMDRVRQRRFRFAATSLAPPGQTDVLVQALDEPPWLAGLPAPLVEPLRRLAAMIGSVRAAVRQSAGVDEVLWAAWAASGRAEVWQRQALGGGAAADVAHRHLDAVLRLFDLAGQARDDSPGLGVLAFVDRVDGQRVREAPDAVRRHREPGVQLLTAHAARGSEWDAVAVVGVQEGRWPLVAARGDVLGVQDLVDVVAHGAVPSEAERRSARLAQERRLFLLAMTRARRRLLVTAVDDESTQPSRFLRDVPVRAQSLPAASVAAQLPALVAELRQVLAGPAPCVSAAERRVAAGLLADLAAAGVVGAAPEEWYGLLPLSDATPDADVDADARTDVGAVSGSTHVPKQAPGGSAAPTVHGEASSGRPGVVTVSPSRVQTFVDCPARWALTQAGGRGPAGVSQRVGMLVHEVAAALAADGGPVTHERAAALMEAGWAHVDAGTGWLARRERARATAMLDRLVTWWQHNPRALLAVEAPVDAVVAGVRVRGRVDRLERADDGSLVVVDLKTGRRPTSARELRDHAQLAAYQVAVGAGAPDGAPVAGASLVQLGLPGSAAVEQRQPGVASPDIGGWAHTLLATVGAGMRAETFAATPGPACRTCPVARSCPARPEGRPVVSVAGAAS
jgi:superfamily I DNA/RNA helicase/RecB family exonuclease